MVSVPFSMGTVLLRGLLRVSQANDARFSPLLDGDGVASITYKGAPTAPIAFQSPSRWGRCCFGTAKLAQEILGFVSVPFSMGTVLLLNTRQVI